MALFCLSYGPDGKVAEAGGLVPHSRRNARFSRPPRRLGRFGFRGAPGRTLTDNPRLRTAPLFILSYRSMKIGCPGWIRTSTIPLNRRADYCYPTEQLKMVSAAGLAPAFPRSQAECVGCYATRCSPRSLQGSRRGLVSCGDGEHRSLKQVPGQDWRTRRELHPGGRALAPLPQTMGRSAD